MLCVNPRWNPPPTDLFRFVRGQSNANGIQRVKQRVHRQVSAMAECFTYASCVGLLFLDDVGVGVQRCVITTASAEPGLPTVFTRWRARWREPALLQDLTRGGYDQAVQWCNRDSFQIAR